MSQRIKQVAVIGAGTMGLGIAQVAAMAGYRTGLYDARPQAVEQALQRITANLDKGIVRGKVSEEQKKSTLQNLHKYTDLEEVEADLVIEAVVEDLQVKQELFARLEERLSPQALLCTNTSSISVTRLAAGLQYPGRFVGLHFFNPAHIMKLVEVVAAATTTDQTLEEAVAFVKNLGKTAIVANDSPGFIVNRVARHFYVESLRVLEEKVADFADIDRLMEASGFKMGPFKLMDLIGMDTNFAVTATMYEGFHYDSKFRPSRIQEQKVLAGHLGRKTGKGFYDYE